MEKIIAGLVFAFLATNAAVEAAHMCGGVLEGQTGDYRFPPAGVEPSVTTSPCLLIIRTLSETGKGIRFVLNQFTTEQQPAFALYAEPLGASGEYLELNPVLLNASDVGTGFELPGKVLIVTLPVGMSSISFQWVSLPGVERGDQVLSAVDYIDTATGEFRWRPSRSAESLTWALTSDVATTVRWTAVAGAGRCVDPCRCFYIGLYTLTLAGRLQVRTSWCGESVSGVFENEYAEHVFLAYTNITNQLESVAFQVYWSPDDPVVPPVDYDESFVLVTTSFSNVQVYSLASTSAVGRIGTDQHGLSVTYNSKNGQVYWSNSNGEVYRADFNGSNVERIWASWPYSSYAVAYDWVGDNIYFTLPTSQPNEYVRVCTADGASCADVQTEGIGRCAGLALDPTKGKMYYTNYERNSIYRANMDGSNATEIVTGLEYPYGIAIDFKEPRLYWAEHDGDKIKSSDLNGKDVRIVLDTNHYEPWGVAVHGDRLYFSTTNSQTVASCNKLDGSDARTEVTFVTSVSGISVADKASQPQPRSNPCDNKPCSHVCVLSSSASFQCLCPEDMKISEDGRTCRCEKL